MLETTGRCYCTGFRVRIGRGVSTSWTVSKPLANGIAAGVNWACADVNHIPGLDPGDVRVFAADLLMGTGCP